MVAFDNAAQNSLAGRDVLHMYHAAEVPVLYFLGEFMIAQLQFDIRGVPRYHLPPHVYGNLTPQEMVSAC